MKRHSEKQKHIQNQAAQKITETVAAAEVNFVTPDRIYPDHIVKTIGAQNPGGMAPPPAAGRKMSRRRMALIVSCAVLALLVAVGGMAFLLGRMPVGVVSKEVELSAESYSALYNALKRIDRRQSGGFAFLTGAEKFAMDEAGVISGTAEATAESDSGYGGTNVQVEGVDEGDILKNDGKYLYVLTENHSDDGHLRYVTILEPQADGSLEKRSEISIGDQNLYPNSIYVTGDRLVVLGTPEITYPYDTEEDGGAYHSSGDSAVALIYDISNRSEPALIRTYKQDGSLLTSRLAGSMLYIVSNRYIYNVDDVDKNKPETFVPCYSDSAYTNGESTVLPESRIAIFPGSSSAGYVIAGCIDLMDETKEPSVSSVLGGGQEIYMTTDSLYVIAAEYAAVPLIRFFDTAPALGSETKTTLLKFNLAGGDITAAGNTTVEGSVYGQFAMNERDGYFQIATTSANEEGDSVNNLFVLDSALQEVGKVAGLAPGETIQSVRFMEDMAYIVTFRQVDPLFAVDLSDPTNPQVVGQLKIPGFSSYLHPYDDQTLIGIGVNGDEDGNIGGIKLSLFDLSDPSDPIEKSKFSLGGQGSSSQAFYDHHAVTFDREKGLLAVPVELYEEGNNIWEQEFEGLLMLKVDESGFTELGYVTCQESEEGSAYRMVTDYYANTVRSTYIGDYWYAVSNSRIVALNVPAFEKVGTTELITNAYSAGMEEIPADDLIPDEDMIITP